MVACSLQMWRWQWKTGTSSRSSRHKKDPVYNNNTHNQKAAYAKISVCTLWCVCLSWWSFDSDCLSFMFRFAYGKEKVFQALQIEHSCLFMNRQKMWSIILKEFEQSVCVHDYDLLLLCVVWYVGNVSLCGMENYPYPRHRIWWTFKVTIEEKHTNSKSTRTGISITPTTQHALVLVDVDVVAPTHSWKNIQANWKMI